MKKYLIAAFAFILTISVVLALNPHNIQEVVVDNSRNDVVITIPQKAVEVSPGIFKIGEFVDSNGRLIEGFAVLDYKKAGAKPDGAGGGKGKNTATSCYAFLSKGMNWKSIEPYFVDTFNNAGLNSSSISSILNSSILEWENAANRDIFGNEAVGAVEPASIGNSANGKNEVIFAPISEPGVIAVTYVWGYYSGPPSQREIVEWDQVYNDYDFQWSLAGETSKMDFENIAQHELGHSFGLGHPDDSCAEETMYRYASLGETMKRDLNAGDIEGIKALYK